MFNARTKRELIRVIPFALLAAIILVPDDGIQVITYSIGIILGFAVLSHIIRRILFPYVDLVQAWNKANDEPMSSAIVFAAVAYVIAAIFQAAIVLLK